MVSGLDCCLVQIVERELGLSIRSLSCFLFPSPWSERTSFSFCLFVIILPMPVGGSGL